MFGALWDHVDNKESPRAMATAKSTGRPELDTLGPLWTVFGAILDISLKFPEITSVAMFGALWNYFGPFLDLPWI